MPGFINPLFLWGVALFSVPLIIHLLNRRRYQKIPWAAMSFLLMAHKKNRRRLQVENLLLLLTRCLAVVLLALAFARPFLAGQSPLLPTVEKRHDFILVLDNSFSMNFNAEGTSPFQKGVEQAFHILDKVKMDRGDRVTLLLSDQNPAVIAWRNPTEVREALTSLQEPSLRGANFPATLDWIRRIVQDFRQVREDSEITVYWISDLQKNSFYSKDPQHDVEKTLAALADNEVKLRIMDVGPASLKPANLGIVDLSLEDLEPNFAGSPISVRAKVHNFGGNDANGVKIRFAVDDNPYASETLDIPAGQEHDVSIIMNIPEAGSHGITANLDPDNLVTDDMRAHAFWIRPSANILAIDGDPQPDALLSETGYLATVLEVNEPGQEVATNLPFVTTFSDRHQLVNYLPTLNNYDLLILANLEGFPQEAVEKLHNYVKSGGAILLSLGDHVDPDYYNAILWKDGAGLLPAKLLSQQAVSSQRTEYYRIAYPVLEHPAFRFFADQKWKPYLTEVPIYGFFRTQTDTLLAGVEIIATLDDPERSAIMLERNLDHGKVALWTSTLDNAWNRVAEQPRTFIPLIFDWLKHLTAKETQERDLEIGAAILLETARFPTRAYHIDPEGKRKKIEGEPRAIGNETFALPEVSQIQKPGIHIIEVEEAAGAQGVATSKTCFAMNVQPQEGNLERLPMEAVPSYFPGLNLLFSEPTAENNKIEADIVNRGEIWRSVAAIGLALLGLESLLAAWFGRRRIKKPSAGGTE